MKQVSVEAAFGWAQRFAAREWALLVPVGIAFFALPGLLVDILLPRAAQALLPGATTDMDIQGRALLAMLAVALVNIVGALAVTALALVPGISVQEAIGRALRRTPTLIGALLLVTVGLIAVVLLLALMLAASRANAAALQNPMVVLIVIGGAALWVSLSMLTPVATERGGSPALALRRAWALAGGAYWRLLGAIVIYFVGGMIVLVAISSALGSIITLSARLLDAAPTGAVLAAIVFRLVAATVSTGFQLLIAAFYRQLAAA